MAEKKSFDESHSLDIRVSLIENNFNHLKEDLSDIKEQMKEGFAKLDIFAYQASEKLAQTEKLQVEIGTKTKIIIGLVSVIFTGITIAILKFFLGV